MFGSSKTKLLFTSKLLKAFPHSVQRSCLNTNGVYLNLVDVVNRFSFNPFCSTWELTNMDESPELPRWVKFFQNEDPGVADSEDEFVIPANANWVENQKPHDHSRDMRSLLSDINHSEDTLSKILNGSFFSPSDVVRALNFCNVNLSETLVEQLLKRFSNDWIAAFGFFKWAKLQDGYKPSIRSYNSMVDILGKSKKFHLLWDLVEEMDKLEGRGVSSITVSKIIRRLARAKRFDDAIDAFRKIERFGLKKDNEALNILLDALAKEHSVEHAENVFLELKDQIPPNSNTFNILIHGYCKSRQMEKAKKTMEQMEKLGINPDVVSYTSLIESYCREKDFRKVDSILDEMKKKNCPPNIVTYTIIMHSLGKAKEINEALGVYERMKLNNCVPDTSFYSSLIYILSKAGRLKDARNVFEDMPKQGVSRDVLTYNTMITTACEYSQEENALKLLYEMEGAQCKPDLNTYAPLLKMCCRKKRMKVLYFLLYHMFKKDVSIELGTYTLLIRGLCKSGKLEHACSFFEEMVLKGFVPNDCTYEMLMKELERKGMAKAIGQIENLMLHAKKGGE